MSAKCCLFLRVSTVRQDYHQQIAKLKTAANDFGYTNDSDFIIIGATESGRKLSEDERETIIKLKEVIETEEIDLVILFEISRLARRMDVLISIRDTLLKRKIQLVCLEPSFTLLTSDRTKIDPNSNLVFNLFGAIAENEAIILRERILKAFEQKQDKGEIVGGRTPFGYRYNEQKQLEIYEEEANVVRYIYDSYEKGLSQSQIARYVKMIYPEKNFLLSQITKILNNELYTGQERCRGVQKSNRRGYVYRTYKYNRKYPPIITLEQFQRCREIANQHRNKRTPSKHIYYGYHLIKCPECGCYWGGGSQRNSYHCVNAYNTQKDISNFGKINCTYKHSISINLLDSLLWHVASVLEAKYIIQDANQNKIEYEKKIEQLKKQLDYTQSQISGIKAKKERIAESYEDGIYSKEKYKERLAKVKDEEGTLSTDKLRYEHQIEQLKELIEGLQSNTFYANIGQHPTIKAMELSEMIKEIRTKTTDDKLRYDIIHRHIMEVIVHQEEASLNIKGERLVEHIAMKRIEIRKYNGEPSMYYYLSHYNKLYFENPETNPKAVLDIAIERRFGDVRNQKRKEAKEKKQQKFLSQFEGYYTPRQIIEKFGIPYTTAVHLHDRYGVPVVHFGKFVAVKIEDAEAFVKKYQEKGSWTPQIVAESLGITKQDVWTAILKGELKANKIRNRLYITDEDFEAYKKKLGK